RRKEGGVGEERMQDPPGDAACYGNRVAQAKSGFTHGALSPSAWVRRPHGHSPHGLSAASPSDASGPLQSSPQGMRREGEPDEAQPSRRGEAEAESLPVPSLDDE